MTLRKLHYRHSRYTFGSLVLNKEKKPKLDPIASGINPIPLILV